jgi:DNA-binding transcriptional regulator GbsR (MarR family)
MTSRTLAKWQAARQRFIEAGGNATQSFGFGRVLGALYALLYLSPKPLSLDDIAAELGVSKASVSTTVRQLESWGAVRQVWVKGDRKDYYEAQADFKAMLRNGVLERVRRKIDHAGEHIETVATALEETLDDLNGDERTEMQIVAARIKQSKEFRDKLNALLNNPLLEHLL